MAFLRSLIGLALLPLTWGLTRGLLDVFANIPLADGWLVSPETIGLASGFGFFLFLWIFMPSPARVYVLGHELTHAIWGMVFGARPSNLKVRADGGSVTLTKTNIWITLAPYFFPFYTVIVVLVAVIVRLCMGSLPHVWIWMFFVGLTWCFHCCFTLQSLFQRQPDILEYGRILSYTLIYLMNVAGVLVWVAATTDVPFVEAIKSAALRTGSAYIGVGIFFLSGVRRLLLYFQSH